MAESFASSSTQTGRWFRPPTASPDTPLRVCIRTLGCKVNQVDSDEMAGSLSSAGVALVCDPGEADVVVVNTCTVTADSDKKSRKSVRRFAALDQRPWVVMTGCMPAVSPEVSDALPENVTVIADREATVAAVSDLAREVGGGCPVGGGADGPGGVAQRRSRVQVKAQDGCDCHCSYCIVPVARGGSRSLPVDSLYQTATRLVESGAEEIVLTGIDLGSYADGERDLGDALEAVARSGVHRIRLSSIEPMHLTERVLDALAGCGALCQHIHLPLQSGSNRILAAMGRPYAAESYLGIVERLRVSVPGIAVTSDVLVGFPSEGEDDFAATMEVCRRAEFAKVHVFRYSRRPGTPAAARADQVPAEDMKQRSQTLREVAADMRESYIDDRLGTVAEVLVEEASSGTESPGCVGTSREYIRVHVPGTALEPGRIIDARLLRREGDVAVGEVAGER